MKCPHGHDNNAPHATLVQLRCELPEPVPCPRPATRQVPNPLDPEQAMPDPSVNTFQTRWRRYSPAIGRKMHDNNQTKRPDPCRHGCPACLTRVGTGAPDAEAWDHYRS